METYRVKIREVIEYEFDVQAPNWGAAKYAALNPNEPCDVIISDRSDIVSTGRRAFRLPRP